MRNFLTIAVLAVGLAMAGTASAQSSSSSGTVGTNVGDSMKQPMTVTTGNDNVHMQPNATSKLLTTVPKVIGYDAWGCERRRLGPRHGRRIGWLHGYDAAQQGDTVAAHFTIRTRPRLALSKFGWSGVE